MTSYFLTDVDGVLCVAAKSGDWAAPRYIVNHYPTDGSVYALCRNLEIGRDELRTALTVRLSFAGYYDVYDAKGRKLFSLCLTEGGKTLPIATTFEPVPVPKVGKGTKLEWVDGNWHRCSASTSRPRVAV
jgi:hypothetical protein